MASYTPQEDQAFMKAFSESKAKTVKERMAAGEAAVAALRKSGKQPKGKHVGMAEKMKNRPKTMMEALEKGIEDGNR